jgi:IclR family mhp operon transcriptional activator
MESTRPIRALMRGLDALIVLNLRNGATVSEIAHDIKLPRTTTYRILETLGHAGFVFRDRNDDRYRLTGMVRSLSDGVEDEAWIANIARPVVLDLAREISWPIAVASQSGDAMIVRETTDHLSPLAVEREAPGTRLPILASAAGRVWLAFSAPAQRDAVLDALARSSRDSDKLARSRAELQELLNAVRELGHAVLPTPRSQHESLSVAVPVIAHEQVVATVSVRCPGSAEAMRSALDRLLPPLHAAARRLAVALAALPPPGPAP